MSRLLSLLLVAALFVAGAPTADAQLGRLLDRARNAVSGSSGSETPAADDRSPATVDGRPAPVMDYLSMMKTRYILRDGYYSADKSPFIIFYPPGPDP